MYVAIFAVRRSPAGRRRRSPFLRLVVALLLQVEVNVSLSVVVSTAMSTLALFFLVSLRVHMRSSSQYKHPEHCVHNVVSGGAAASLVQGAVLDQLAGDVHNLELQRDEDAVRLRLGPQLPLEPLETTNQSGSPCEEVRETDGENGCRTHDLVASTTFARVLNSRDSGAREQGREENALLRSNLREARRHAEGLRRRLTTEQKK